MNEQIQPYQPTPLPVVPPGMAVAYTPQGQPVYIPQQQAAPQPVIVQMPSQPLPAWIRNLLALAVGMVILCTPAAVLLVFAAPAVMAMGEGLAYGGIGIGIGVIGVAAAIKALRETPAAKKTK
ncbi:hypothetical protein [Streptomyces sp. NPDC001297]|uniref:hypothetical protein n=1 Tax=Streptomyces sp. NPDC001297 TaxID=3364559 RepID=UPI0036C45352